MKLLLTGAFPYEYAQLNLLEQLGYEIVFTEREDQKLSAEAYEAEAVVCNWLLTHQDIHLFRNLKYIQLLSAGLDRVPLEYIREHDITLNNARGVYSIPMAEFAVGSVLQLYKDSLEFAQQSAEHKWLKRRGLQELFGRRVLVIGAGSVGSEVAKRFKAFTDEVYGLDLIPQKNPAFLEVKPLSQIDTELSKSDIVVLTLPLTDETRGLLDRDRLFRIKKGAILVNIARGGIIDEMALIEALKDHLYGAALDVFDVEPLPEDSALWDCPNALITPHNSFVSNCNSNRMWECIYHNLKTISENMGNRI